MWVAAVGRGSGAGSELGMCGGTCEAAEASSERLESGTSGFVTGRDGVWS